ncbi:MAG: ATP-binding protein [Syntrophobacteraceae bacterium]
MHIEFRHKIFLAFLLNSAAIIVCILLIGNYYGQRHFKGYLAGVEAQRISKLCETLAAQYKRQGSWKAVLEDRESAIHFGAFSPCMALGLFAGPPLSAHGGPREPFENRAPGPAPPPFNGNFQAGPPPGPPLGGQPDPLPLFAGGAPLPPLAIFDANKRSVAPRGDFSSADNYRLTPVKVNGQVVGWVGLRKFGPFEPPTHHLDVEFMKRQAQTFYGTGLCVLILGSFLTFVLSRRLLAPVRELERGIKAIGSRRFDTRIGVVSNDELGRLAQGFNAMAQALEKHQQTQQQWIADISHELRTPLAILRGEIEAMQDALRAVTERSLDSLHQEVLHLSRIVSDLHELSLIESATFDCNLSVLEPVSVLCDTAELFRARLELRGLGLDLQKSGDEEVLVLADPDRLKQLFSNIFENTLRYAEVPGSLKVSHTTQGDRFLVTFEDSGPGVPEQSLPFLFDRLYRVDRARTRKNGGSGLGLSICKSIMESFSGSINASNSSDGGLKIVLSFGLHCGIDPDRRSHTGGRA